MTGEPYIGVELLHNLPIQERLMTCTMCGTDTLRTLQLRVIGHQIALCVSCVQRLAAAADRRVRS